MCKCNLLGFLCALWAKSDVKFLLATQLHWSPKTRLRGGGWQWHIKGPLRERCNAIIKFNDKAGISDKPKQTRANNKCFSPLSLPLCEKNFNCSSAVENGGGGGCNFPHLAFRTPGIMANSKETGSPKLSAQLVTATLTDGQLSATSHLDFVMEMSRWTDGTSSLSLSRFNKAIIKLSLIATTNYGASILAYIFAECQGGKCCAFYEVHRNLMTSW